MRRIVAAVIGAVGAALGLCGCASQPTACDDAFTPSQFGITATSASGADERLVLCIGGSCSAPVSRSGLHVGHVGGADVDSSLPKVSAAQQNGWNVGLVRSRNPSTVIVHIGPADGATTSSTLHLSWHPGDPSDPCHHWYTVDPVRIAVP